MDALLIGYARVSTEEQDLTAQRDALAALGVSAERTYVDQGLTGTNRERPGLRQALAACRAGDTLVVTKLDRLARSLPDARTIVEELTRREVKLSLGGAVHDPTDPVGRLLFNVLAVIQATGCLSPESSQPQAGFAAPFPATSQSDVAAPHRHIRCRVSESDVGFGEKRTSGTGHWPWTPPANGAPPVQLMQA